jgi:hypothetical protein
MPAIALVAAGARLGLSLGKIFGGHGFDVALIARSKARSRGLPRRSRGSWHSCARCTR